jgi:hypothetical protein
MAMSGLLSPVKSAIARPSGTAPAGSEKSAEEGSFDTVQAKSRKAGLFVAGVAQTVGPHVAAIKVIANNIFAAALVT